MRNKVLSGKYKLQIRLAGRSHAMNCEKLNHPYIELDASSIDPLTVFDLAVSAESLFTASGVYSSVSEVSVIPKYRHSLSLGDMALVGRMVSPIQTLVERNHEKITRTLGLKAFSIGRLEASCVVFGNGSFFQRHRDTISAVPERRRYTWVYYFHRQPRLFTGGALRFFNRQSITAEVEPENGRLIVFRADTPHEVTQVELVSEEFAAGRFTLTGFVYDSAGPFRRLKFSVDRQIDRLPFSRSKQQVLRKYLRSLARRIEQRWHLRG